MNDEERLTQDEAQAMLAKRPSKKEATPDRKEMTLLAMRAIFAMAPETFGSGEPQLLDEPVLRVVKTGKDGWVTVTFSFTTAVGTPGPGRPKQ